MEFFGVCLGMAAAFAFFWYAWKYDSGRQLVFTPFLIFALNEITRNWVAAAMAPSLGMSHDYGVLWIELLAFVAFVGGFLVAFAARRGIPGEAAELRSRPITPIEVPRAVFAILVTSLILTLAGLYLYRGVPPVLLGLKGLLLQGSGLEAANFVSDSRETVTKSAYFGGAYRGQGALLKLMGLGWPLLMGCSLVLYRATRRWSLLGLTGLTLIATFAFVAGAGDRGPFLWCLVYLFLVGSFLFHVRYRTMVYGFVGLVFLAIGMSLYSRKLYSSLGSDNFIEYAIGKIVERIFLGNGVFTVEIIELVRAGIWKMRYGAVFVQNLVNALPGVSSGSLPLAHDLYAYNNPGGTLTTYLTPTYFAEVFIDFGTYGSAVLYFVLGIVIGMAQAAILRLPKSVILLPLASVAMLLLGRIPNVGIAGMLAAVVITLVVTATLVASYQLARLLSPRHLSSGPPPSPNPVPE